MRESIKPDLAKSLMATCENTADVTDGMSI